MYRKYLFCRKVENLETGEVKETMKIVTERFLAESIITHRDLAKSRPELEYSISIYVITENLVHDDDAPKRISSTNHRPEMGIKNRE